jgi:hypothetical protein
MYVTPWLLLALVAAPPQDDPVPAHALRLARALGAETLSGPIEGEQPFTCELAKIRARRITTPDLMETNVFCPPQEASVGRSTAQERRNAVRLISPLDFGARADGVTNDAGAINAAIRFAAELGGLAEVNGGGFTYLVEDPAQDIVVRVLNRVVLRNLKLRHIGEVDYQAVVGMGHPDGGNLTRPGGIENVYVKTTSRAKGVAGFRLDTLVRSSWIRTSIAEMNEDTEGTRGHTGFEIVSTRINAAKKGYVGTYENTIDGTTALNAKYCYRLYSRGTMAEAIADAQVTGNRIVGSCYASVTSAAVLDYGSQENDVRIRADTFVGQNGRGTSIFVVDVKGAKNRVVIDEEIGARADTQYTVRFSPEAKYNRVEYHTQQVVTGQVLDLASDVTKNLAVNIGQIVPTEGRIVNVGYYSRPPVPARSERRTLHKWLAPQKALITTCVARLDSPIASAGSFNVYLAKNGKLDTINQMTFRRSEPRGAQALVADPDYAGHIPVAFLLTRGDSLDFIFENTTAEDVAIAVSCNVGFLHD